MCSSIFFEQFTSIHISLNINFITMFTTSANFIYTETIQCIPGLPAASFKIQPNNVVYSNPTFKKYLSFISGVLSKTVLHLSSFSCMQHARIVLFSLTSLPE